jgi:hypothetical protein
MSNQSLSPARSDLFTWSHCGCGAFVGLLALVWVISLFYGFGRTLWPTRTAVGRVGPVEETHLNSWQAAYHVVLEPEDGELLVLRLRNNGRIFHYLSNQPPGQPVSVRHAQGEIWELAPLAPAGPSVREFSPAWPGLLLLLSGGAALLYLLGKPWLASWPLSRLRIVARFAGSNHEPGR